MQHEVVVIERKNVNMNISSLNSICRYNKSILRKVNILFSVALTVNNKPVFFFFFYGT